MIGVNGAFLFDPSPDVQQIGSQLMIGLLEARPDLSIRTYVPPHTDSRVKLLDQMRALGADVVVGPPWTRNRLIFEQMGMPLMALGDRVTTLVHLNNRISVLRRRPQVCLVNDVASLRRSDGYRRAYGLRSRGRIGATERRNRPTIVALSALMPGEFRWPMLLDVGRLTSDSAASRAASGRAAAAGTTPILTTAQVRDTWRAAGAALGATIDQPAASGHG